MAKADKITVAYCGVTMKVNAKDKGEYERLGYKKVTEKKPAAKK